MQGRYEIIIRSFQPLLNTITAQYNQDLYNIGRNSVKYGIEYLIDQTPQPLPKLLRLYFGYKEEKKEEKKEIQIPKEIIEAFRPLYNPIIQGANEELEKIYKKVLPIVGVVLFIFVAGTFCAGYYTGKYVEKRKKK